LKSQSGKMNYFELFEIPVQLKVDTATLHKKFFELSRKFHPDYFVNEKPEAQAVSLEQSALLNKAYKTFKSPDETIRYVLQQKDLLQEEEKYELPAGFLMEVLEINEQLMDADQSGTGSQESGAGSLEPGVAAAVDKFQSEIYEPVKEIVEHYQEGVTTEKELLQVKEYYYKKKYLDRIRHQLKGKT
jgi:molecular chaperone HscB